MRANGFILSSIDYNDPRIEFLQQEHLPFVAFGGMDAAHQLGLLPNECVVVEDAAAGIQAAQAGGFYAVGLGPPERVGGADAIFPNLERLQLPQLLNALDVTG